MTPGIRPLIAGNWKMNGTIREAIALAEAIGQGAPRGEADPDLVIFPPFLHLHAVGSTLMGHGVAMGAQTCHPEPKGAHTGDVSAAMLRDIGCAYVLVGHSERRLNHHESDADVRDQGAAAIVAGLVPVLCLGETMAQKAAGQSESIIQRQLQNSLPDGFSAARGVVAYEPDWAIGTGRTPSEEDITTIHALLRRLAPAGTRLLGGASLAAADFLAIAAAAS
jgi:triosephosphate isomerase